MWYCRLRWLVVSILVVYGLLGQVGPWVQKVGWRHPGIWPFLAAGALIAANIGFLWNARHGRTHRMPQRNLWSQIILDLLVLTVVVHFMGSMETPIAFTYLFHIVLACVFLTPRQSLRVTAIAALLFATCVGLEVSALVSSTSILANASGQHYILQSPVRCVTSVGMIIGIWLVVWCLASHLSDLVRRRDVELVQANEHLEAALSERAQHMLRTTHELKSPFAAITANAQLLLEGYCGELPEQAVAVVQRIKARCARLSDEIHAMLQLANLRSSCQDKVLVPAEVDLQGLLRMSLDQVNVIARERGIDVEEDFEPATTVVIEDHARMLLENLLANAIHYSYEDGRITVTCHRDEAQGPVVTIADEGIGIAPDKLPHIFDDYYRTKEAVKHNQDSTGLGLAIVRNVAQINHIQVQVRSCPGKGTTFFLRFPAPHKDDRNETS